MYYEASRKAFRENLEAADPAREPERYNLYAGLIALTSAIERDLARLTRLLEQIESRLPVSSAGPLAGH